MNRTLKKSARTLARHKRLPNMSGEVVGRSNAVDVDPKVFTSADAQQIAAALKHSAEANKSRKGTSFRSAMSVITFYLNRAGTALSRKQRRVLERAKESLRKNFGRSDD